MTTAAPADTEARRVQRRALRRQLRARLGALGAPLQLLAEDLLGEEDEPIDWVAVEPGGRAWVGLVAVEEDEDLLVRGLVQRAWVHARLPDWLRLAPGLAVRPEARPRLVLLAPGFSRRVRIAAREADAEGIRLVRFRWGPGRDEAGCTLELLDFPALPAREPAGAEGATPAPRRPLAPVLSVFRCGLDERDFEDVADGPRPA